MAQYFEERELSGTEAVAAVARHWRDAGRPDRAVGYLVAAAEQAARGWAKDSAAVFYGEALTCLPPDDPLRRKLQVRAAMAAAAALHIADVRDVLRQATPATDPSPAS